MRAFRHTAAAPKKKAGGAHGTARLERGERRAGSAMRPARLRGKSLQNLRDARACALVHSLRGGIHLVALAVAAAAAFRLGRGQQKAQALHHNIPHNRPGVGLQ